VAAADLAGCLELRHEYGSGLAIEFVDFPDDEWVLLDGRIAHRRTDFFSVVGQRDASGVERLLFRQPETALVGLLTAMIGGERHLLLSARVEPGLHGACQFSSTIQSTPSNYERRHGGAPTPLIDLFLDPGSRARVVHDSRQYDWGQYYDAKVKRFLILEVTELIPAEAPLVWVPQSVFDELANEDFAVTGDLRAAALSLAGHPVATSDAAGPGVARSGTTDGAVTDVPLGELRNWRMLPAGIDEIDPVQGVELRYVRTRTSSREVGEWSQPLMVVDADLEVRLPVRAGSGGVECAVRRRTAPGLRGVELWYPAEPAERTLDPAPVVRASAEGGRFLRHEVRISTVEVDAVEPGSRWMPLETVYGWAAADRATSLDLRLALATFRPPIR
jgi:oxidase EvaA